ncbi:hypothetical protein CYLTODRAFT_457290 [Cylindrobasidium torrendii FP15055 ss-10]|uniref:Transcription factor domain-containing protein n=1 Tax=Cylindrobasidium torrendii FP15055 ss-10 TaxID=1314674 RepID=A0A0D7B2A5_9AGAR|nr:hypothetical protein CYLTODRAFT_457290 [Cylindrobasidium torrendii FP15055 ss-10]
MKAIRSMGSNMASSGEWTSKHDDLIIATVLLQFLCIHHESRAMRNMGKSAHDQLFQIMDSWQIFERVKTWTQRCRPEALNARDVDEAWTDWARCESLRRAIMAAFIEEGCMLCCLSVAPSSRGHADYEFNLTCDDALWQARSAAEWRRIWRTARSPSMALTGTPSQLASRQLSRRGALFESRVPTALNLHPMDLFYLIHTLLREILERASVSWRPDAPEETAVAMAALQVDFRAALNIWMALWKSATESLPADYQAPFFKNALPFYWLTQVILSALQYGDVLHLIEMGDKRVFVMDAWLQRIRLFIRSRINREEMWAEMASVCQRIADSDDHFPLVGGFATFLLDKDPTFTN